MLGIFGARDFTGPAAAFTGQAHWSTHAAACQLCTCHAIDVRTFCRDAVRIFDSCCGRTPGHRRHLLLHHVQHLNDPHPNFIFTTCNIAAAVCYNVGLGVSSWNVSSPEQLHQEETHEPPYPPCTSDNEANEAKGAGGLVGDGQHHLSRESGALGDLGSLSITAQYGTVPEPANKH